LITERFEAALAEFERRTLAELAALPEFERRSLAELAALDQQGNPSYDGLAGPMA
jgi:hypothetical protein